MIRSEMVETMRTTLNSSMFGKTIAVVAYSAGLVCWNPQADRIMSFFVPSAAAAPKESAQDSSTVENQVKELINQFDTRDRSAATFAEMSICRIGPSAIPTLLAASGTATELQLSHIGHVMGVMGQAAVPTLVSELNDPNPVARRAAIAMLDSLRAEKALGTAGEASVASALAGRLNDEDERPRGMAFRVLPNFGRAAVEPLIRALGDREGHVHTLAVGILAGMGASIAPQLVSGMENHETDTKDLAYVLVEIGKPAVPALLVGLKSADLVVQIGCAAALGSIGDMRAVNPLIGALRRGKIPLRATSAKVLGDLGDKRALPELTKAAQHDDEDRVREIAKAAIEKIRSARIH
jgi:HEAT repeat protein